jgi:single-strand DNA-binding protein
MNSICITGRLTAAPDHRAASAEDGTRSFAEFRIAINEPGSQTNNDRCSFISVICFGPMADSVNTYLGKGSMVGVQGRIQQREWTNADEQRRSMHRVVAHRVEFLEFRSDATGRTSGPKAVTDLGAHAA